MGKTVDIEPNQLREECLNYGLFYRVCLDLIKEQKGEIDEKVKEGILLLGAYFLYEHVLSSASTALYYAGLGYEERKMEKADGGLISFPLWGEEKEKEEERVADSFFPLACLYFGKMQEIAPEDCLGAVLFFSGAIKEDILQALSKKEGDPLYDAFKTEISSYPFAQSMEATARKFFDMAHNQA